jgi:hypothetical protein
MPGIMLTRVQMQRVWGIDAGRRDAVIGWLEERRAVRGLRAGQYVAFGSPA